MSLLHTCARCGNEWETGLGREGADLCRECRKVDERLESGGEPFTGSERAAAATMFDYVVTSDGVIEPDDFVGQMVMDDDGLADFGSDEFRTFSVV